MSITGSDLKTKITLRPLVAEHGGQELRHGKGVVLPAMTERIKSRVIFAPHAAAADQGMIFTVRERPVELSQLIEWQGRTYLPTETWTEARGWRAIKAVRLRVRQWCYAGPRPEPTYTGFPGVLCELYRSRADPDYHSEIDSGYLLVTPTSVDLRPNDLLICEGKTYRVELGHKLDEDVREYELYTQEDV